MPGARASVRARRRWRAAALPGRRAGPAAAAGAAARAGAPAGEGQDAPVCNSVLLYRPKEAWRGTWKLGSEV